MTPDDRWSVVLNKTEQRICAWVGKQRYASARTNGRDPGEGPTKFAEDAANDIRGADCEYGASLLLNLYWKPWVGDIGEAKRMRDVGGLVEVRSTVLPDGRLIVKPGDPDDVPFALIVHHGGRLRLAGWLFAIEAKRRWPLIADHGDPAHYATQGALRSNISLLEWIGDQRKLLKT